MHVADMIPKQLCNLLGGFPKGGRGSPGGGGRPRGYGLSPPPITKGSTPWSYGQLSPKIQNPFSAKVEQLNSISHHTIVIRLTIIVLASLSLLSFFGVASISSLSLPGVLSSAHTAPSAGVRVTIRVVVTTATTPTVGRAMTTMVPPPSCPTTITTKKNN